MPVSVFLRRRHRPLTWDRGLAVLFILVASSSSTLLCQQTPEFVLQPSLMNGGRIKDLKFGPDGQFLVAAGENMVELLSIPELGVIRRWSRLQSGSFHSVSSDASSLVLLRNDTLVSVPVMGGAPEGRIPIANTANDTAVYTMNREPPTDVGARAHPPFIVGADGHLIAAGDENGAVWLLDAQGQQSSRLNTPDATVHWYSYHVPSRRIALAFEDRRIHLYDVTTGRMLTGLPRFLGHREDVDGLEFSPDGRVLATVASDGLLLWDTRDGEFLMEVAAGLLSLGSTIAFSPDGAWIAVGTYDGLRLCSVKSGACIAPVTDSSPIEEETRSTVSAIAFHPDSATRMLAVGTENGSVRLWRWDSGELVAERRSARHNPQAVLSADGRWLATFHTWGEAVRLWDLAENSGPQSLEVPVESGLSVLAFSPDGRLLAGGGMTGQLTIWETQSGKVVTAAEAHPQYIRALAFDASGTILASGSDYPALKLWNPTTGELLDSIVAARCNYCIDAVGALAFLPDGTLASGGQTGRELEPMLRVWDLGSRREIASMAEPTGHYESISQLSVHNGLLWAGGSTLRAFTLPGLDSAFSEPEYTAFAVGGPAIAVTTPAGDVRIVAAPDARAVHLEREVEEMVEPVSAITPDGSRALVVDGPFIRIFETRTGEELARVFTDPSSSEWLVFTRGGELDGSPAALGWLAWRTADGRLLTGHAPPVTERRYVPGLLACVLGRPGERPASSDRQAHCSRTNAPQ